MKHGEIKIQSPCTVDWQKMTPAEGGKFCGDCKKVVRDLSKMSERDATALLHQSRNAELCVRYLYDRDGKVVFAGDPPAAFVSASLLSRARRAAIAAAAITATLGIEACTAPVANEQDTPTGFARPTTHDDPDLNWNMGGMVPPDDPPPPPPGEDAGTDAATDASPPAERDGGTDTDASTPDSAPPKPQI